MKTLYSILLLLLTCLHPAYSQLIIDSTRFITGLKCCTQISYAIPTADKGILFVGSDANNPGGIIPYFPIDTSDNGNVMIGKIDSNHQISWIRVYGGSDADGASGVVQTPDGGYAVLAATASDDGDVTGFLGMTDIWLLRIDDSGNLLWEKCYGSPYQDWCISIANTPDHGFIILGGSYGSGDEVPFHYGNIWDADWLVIKTDSVGNFQWGKDLGGTGDEGSNGTILAIDSSYYLISSSNSTDHDCTDTTWHSGLTFTGGNYYVLKLDDTGKVLWDSSYGGSGGDNIYYAMFDTRDSTIVITGNTASSDYMVTGFHGWQDMWVIKVNENGTLLWEKTLGDSTNQETATGICATYNEGYVAYGWIYTGTVLGGGGDCNLFTIDNSGNEINNKVFGGTGYDISGSILPYLDGYIATGISNSILFTEGTTYGDFDDGGAFITYIDSGTLNVVTPPPHPPFTVYPNPANDNVTIILPQNESGNLSILNTLGQIIYRENIKQQTPYIEISIGELTQGLYIVKWQSEDGSVQTEKLIKY